MDGCMTRPWRIPLRPARLARCWSRGFVVWINIRTRSIDAKPVYRRADPVVARACPPLWPGCPSTTATGTLGPVDTAFGPSKTRWKLWTCYAALLPCLCSPAGAFSGSFTSSQYSTGTSTLLCNARRSGQVYQCMRSQTAAAADLRQHGDPGPPHPPKRACSVCVIFPFRVSLKILDFWHTCFAVYI